MTLSPARFFGSEAFWRSDSQPHTPQEEAPHHPNLEATYKDMTAGGQPRTAELTVNMDTLDFLLGAMYAANRQRLLNAKNHEAAGRIDQALAQRARMQTFLVTLLQEARINHDGLPDDTIVLVDETARQSRTFIADSAQKEVEGLDAYQVADMEFLHATMRGLNEHPPIDPNKPLVPQLGNNNYQTEQKRDWADPQAA